MRSTVVVAPVTGTLLELLEDEELELLDACGVAVPVA